MLFVGVHCPIEVIMERRRAAATDRYLATTENKPIPSPVLRWQQETHAHWRYDLEVDTSLLSPTEAANAIRARLNDSKASTAFAELRTLQQRDG